MDKKNPNLFLKDENYFRQNQQLTLCAHPKSLEERGTTRFIRTFLKIRENKII